MERLTQQLVNGDGSVKIQKAFQRMISLQYPAQLDNLTMAMEILVQRLEQGEDSISVARTFDLLVPGVRIAEENEWEDYDWDDEEGEEEEEEKLMKVEVEESAFEKSEEFEEAKIEEQLTKGEMKDSTGEKAEDPEEEAKAEYLVKVEDSAPEKSKKPLSPLMWLFMAFYACLLPLCCYQIYLELMGACWVYHPSHGPSIAFGKCWEWKWPW